VSDAADCIESAIVPSETVLAEIADESLISGDEHLEGSVLSDLAGEVTGRSERQLTSCPGISLEGIGYLNERELKIGSSGHDRRLLQGATFYKPRQKLRKPNDLWADLLAQFHRLTQFAANF
jgi:hypothetical protein